MRGTTLLSVNNKSGSIQKSSTT